MTTLYRRRHTDEAHRAPSVRGGGARDKPHLFSRALRRPLGSLAAVVAVAGASAGGIASAAKPHTSTASFTPSRVAVAQATALTPNPIDTNTDLAEGRRVRVQRVIALAQLRRAQAETRAAAALTRAHRVAALARARTAAAAAQTQARAAAAAQSEARTAEAERTSRESTRQSLLARAQSDPKSVARELAGLRGWGGQQFDCLSSLWTKESGWRWDANNPSSDAYGIPQALPGSKMASFGSDWETNPVTQIKWGLEYISSSYGTPCSAWAKSQASNWY